MAERVGPPMGDRGLSVTGESCCVEDAAAAISGEAQTVDEREPPGDSGRGCEVTARQRRDERAGEYGTTRLQVVVCPGDSAEITKRDGDAARRE